MAYLFFYYKLGKIEVLINSLVVFSQKNCEI
jgi:hypothetical protein